MCPDGGEEIAVQQFEVKELTKDKAMSFLADEPICKERAKRVKTMKNNLTTDQHDSEVETTTSVDISL